MTSINIEDTVLASYYYNAIKNSDNFIGFEFQILDIGLPKLLYTYILQMMKKLGANKLDTFTKDNDNQNIVEVKSLTESSFQEITGCVINTSIIKKSSF